VGTANRLFDQRSDVAAKFILGKDASGGFRFRMMSQGRVLASSETYTTKRAAQNAIASIQAAAAGAGVEDETQAGPGKGGARPPATSPKKLDSVIKAPRRAKAPATAQALVAPAAGGDMVDNADKPKAAKAGRVGRSAKKR